MENEQNKKKREKENRNIIGMTKTLQKIRKKSELEFTNLTFLIL